MGIQKHVSKRQLLMLLFLENLRHSLHWMRGTTVFYKDLHLRSFMTFISNAGYRNKFYKYESWNVHTFVSQNVFTARKTEGPQAYSRYIGSSARAEWPTFLPSYSVSHIITYPSKELCSKMALGEVVVSLPWWCLALVLQAPGYWGLFLNLIIFL